MAVAFSMTLEIKFLVIGELLSVGVSLLKPALVTFSDRNWKEK